MRLPLHALQGQRDERERRAYLVYEVDEEVNLRLIHLLFLLHAELLHAHLVAPAHALLRPSHKVVDGQSSQQEVGQVGPRGAIPWWEHGDGEARHLALVGIAGLAQQEGVLARSHVGIGGLGRSRTVRPLLVHTFEHVLIAHVGLGVEARGRKVQREAVVAIGQLDAVRQVERAVDAQSLQLVVRVGDIGQRDGGDVDRHTRRAEAHLVGLERVVATHAAHEHGARVRVVARPLHQLAVPQLARGGHMADVLPVGEAHALDARLGGEPQVLLAILGHEVDVAILPHAHEGIGLLIVSAQAASHRGEPHLPSRVAIDVDYRVARQRVWVAAVVGVTVPVVVLRPIAEHATVGRGNPEHTVGILGHGHALNHRAHVAVGHEVLRTAVVAAQAPSGAHHHLALARLVQAAYLVARHGVGCEVGVDIGAHVARPQVRHLDAIHGRAHPQVVVVEQQGRDGLAERLAAIGLHVVGLAVVAVQAVAGTYPQVAIARVAEGLHQHAALGGLLRHGMEVE